MYELKIQANNELKQYDIAVKGFDNKFFSLAVAAAYVMDMQIYEMKPTGEICSVE